MHSDVDRRQVCWIVISCVQRRSFAVESMCVRIDLFSLIFFFYSEAQLLFEQTIQRRQKITKDSSRGIDGLLLEKKGKEKREVRRHRRCTYVLDRRACEALSWMRSIIGGILIEVGMNSDDMHVIRAKEEGDSLFGIFGTGVTGGGKVSSALRQLQQEERRI